MYLQLMEKQVEMENEIAGKNNNMCTTTITEPD